MHKVISYDKWKEGDGSLFESVALFHLCGGPCTQCCLHTELV